MGRLNFKCMRIDRNTIVNGLAHLTNRIVDVQETQIEHSIKRYDYRWNQCLWDCNWYLK